MIFVDRRNSNSLFVGIRAATTTITRRCYVGLIVFADIIILLSVLWYDYPRGRRGKHSMTTMMTTSKIANVTMTTNPTMTTTNTIIKKMDRDIHHLHRHHDNTTTHTTIATDISTTATTTTTGNDSTSSVAVTPTTTSSKNSHDTPTIAMNPDKTNNKGKRIPHNPKKYKSLKFSIFWQSFYQRFHIYINEYKIYHYRYDVIGTQRYPSDEENNHNRNSTNSVTPSSTWMFMIPPPHHDDPSRSDLYEEEFNKSSYFWRNDENEPQQNHNLTLRSQRFLSIEQRLQIYLFHWYIPPCHPNDPSMIQYTYYHDNSDDDDKISRIPNNDDNHTIPNATNTKSTKMTTKTNMNISLSRVALLYSNDDKNTTWDIHNDVKADILFYIVPQHIYEQVHNKDDDFLLSYSKDVMETLLPAMTMTNSTIDEPAVIIQYGDWTNCREHNDRKTIRIPHFKKFRNAVPLYDRHYFQQILHNTDHPILSSDVVMKTCTNASRSSQPQPILWKLNSKRHYGLIPEVDRYDTIPFDEKYNVAVYRGALTGHDKTWHPNVSDYDNCYRIARCSLVLQYDNSIYVDAKITKPYNDHHPLQITYSNHAMNITRVYNYRGGSMSIRKMVQYKMIIMLEGNDVSSGLKWALYSNCIVLMPYPLLVTSWSLEETLIPYVHFVPLYHNLSNVMEQIQWILHHPQYANYINLRSTLFIHDLLYHPQAHRDDHILYQNIYNTYQKHYHYYNISTS